MQSKDLQVETLCLRLSLEVIVAGYSVAVNVFLKISGVRVNGKSFIKGHVKLLNMA
jgi:hypothetical protein